MAVVGPWCAVVAVFVCASRFRHPAIFVACALAIGTLHHHLAVIAHQSAHYRLFKTRWLNDLAGRIASYPLGVSLQTYRIIHRTHHNHLYEAIDPDLAQIAGYPRGRLYLVRKLAKDLAGITVVKNYLYFFGRQARRPVSDSNDETSLSLRRAARIDQRMMIASNVVLFGVLAFSGAWKAYLVLWVLPLATWFQMLLRLRAVCEHGAPTDTSSPWTAARTNVGPFWVMGVLFPLHMNFHIEHHLYPSIPHYRLPECHREMVKAGLFSDERRAESISFWKTLGKIFAPPRQAAATAPEAASLSK